MRNAIRCYNIPSLQNEASFSEECNKWVICSILDSSKAVDNFVQLNFPQCCSSRCGLERSLAYSILECAFTSVPQENKSKFLLMKTSVANGMSLGRWALPVCRQMWGRAAWAWAAGADCEEHWAQTRDLAQGCWVPASSLEPLGEEGRAWQLTRACKTPCRAVSMEWSSP